MKTKHITYSAILVSLGVIGSYFNIPIGVSKCMPVQHIINVLGAVTLGPGYAVLTAFLISLIRNILGTGTLLAFPGSMIGAFLAGILYVKTDKKLLAVLGEVFGTGILGAFSAFIVANFVLGKNVAAFFFVAPFMINTVAGSLIAYFILKSEEIAKSTLKIGNKLG